jgi:LysM repeat protein
VYARRRAVLAAFVGLLVGGGLFARSAVAENPAPVGGIEMPLTVTVVQGDTLWAIAHRLVPNGDVMGMVDRLVELNGDSIVPGQQILIP